MTQPVGGLRDRLIHESLFRVVRDGLVALGWGASTDVSTPLSFLPESVPDDVEVELNSVVVAPETISASDSELGFSSSDDEHVLFVDFYGESDWVSRHVVGDIRDLVRGRMPAVGRGRSVIDVYDWEMATPSLLFYVTVEEVLVDVASGFREVWRRHWRTVRVTLRDEYLEGT